MFDHEEEFLKRCLETFSSPKIPDLPLDLIQVT